MAVSTLIYPRSVIIDFFKITNQTISANSEATFYVPFNKRLGYQSRALSVFMDGTDTSGPYGYSGLLVYARWSDYTDGRSSGSQNMGVSIRNTRSDTSAKFTLNVAMMYYR